MWLSTGCSIRNFSDHEHSHPLPRAVADVIYPIFDDLSDRDLFRRCLHGGTQNQNEAINALIWQRATKETNSGLPTVQLAVFLAVSYFNDGAASIILVLSRARNHSWNTLSKCLQETRPQQITSCTQKEH